jgi:hypothetical protein
VDLGVFLVKKETDSTGPAVPEKWTLLSPPRGTWREHIPDEI